MKSHVFVGFVLSNLTCNFKEKQFIWVFLVIWQHKAEDMKEENTYIKLLVYARFLANSGTFATY